MPHPTHQPALRPGRHPGVFFARLLLGGVLLGATATRADPLRVDVDAAWPARGDTTAAGFTAWPLLGSLDATRRSATATFTGLPAGPVTCTVAQTSPAPADAPATVTLTAGWLNKNGIAGGYKLAFDGAWVHEKDDARGVDRPWTGGGALRLTITGLAPGPHTLTTYHNAIWGQNYGPISRVQIAVDGVPRTVVTPSPQVTRDDDCAFAFLAVHAIAGQPIVVDFTPDHSGPLDTVILNGFEIDRPSAPGATAAAPTPADGDTHVPAGLEEARPGQEGTGRVALTWTPAAAAVAQDVYFGLDRAAVAVATRASPLYRGRLTGSSRYEATELRSGAPYYWRVDTVTAAGAVLAGEVWSFQPRHLAFPGAEGYGRFARGGRGGRVLEVTNLRDYEAGEAPILGSYRAAIEATGPRTVVFRVSGLIRLKRPCPINSAHGHLTLAGQTAPGEGICLADYRAGIGGASDVIIRHLRVRVGDAARTAMDGLGMGAGTDHSIVDHCTISWTTDEGTSARDARNITFQRNLVAEALQHSYHYAADDRTKYETHAFAGSISGQIGSFHHNLLAHCTDRNWSLAGGLTQDGRYAGWLDIRNNVVYNWTARTTDGGVFRCNYVANYYRPYPKNPYVTWLLKLDAINPDWGAPLYYMADNVMAGHPWDADNWAAFQNGAAVAAAVRSPTPLFAPEVTTHTARQAFKLVLSDVGANQPVADVIDQRIGREVRTGTTTYTGTRSTNWPNNLRQPPPPNYPGIIDTPDDVRDALDSPNAPWPAYATRQVPADRDHDGLPDYWELAVGSDPDAPSHNEDPDGDGYTRLEEYLDWLAGPHALAVAEAPVRVPLRELAAGFDAPTFALGAAQLGTVALAADGATAIFTPTRGARGRGGFAFTATDPDGVAMTRSVGVCLVATEPEYLAPTTPDRAAARLGNLAVRAALAGAGGPPLTAGFVVTGPGAKRLLLRGIGPALRAWGVTNALADPVLSVYDRSGRILATNDQWGTGDTTELAAAFAATSAFALPDAASRDAALLLWLPPGVYSATVASADGSAGEALLEVYEVP